MKSWIETTLGDEFEVVMGQSPPSKFYNDRGEGLPFFQGKKEFGDIYPSIENWSTVATKVAEKDDVLLSIRAPIGPVNIAPAKCGIGRGLAAIRPNKKTSAKFIYYLIKAKENELIKRGSGVTFSAITKPNLYSLPILLPETIEERNQIVEAIETQFTRLDSAIRTLKSLRNKLDIYRKSALKAVFDGKYTGVFDFEKKKINSFDRKGGGTPSTKNEKYWNGDINWLTSANISDRNEITYDRTITEEGVQNSSTNIIPKGSVIVVTRVGLGKAAVNEDDVAINQDCQGILCDKEVNPYYLMWQIKSLANEIIFGAQGTTISGITINKLNELEVKMPARAVQDQLVEVIDANNTVMDEAERTIERCLKKAGQLKKSILKSAFEGKLVKEGV